MRFEFETTKSKIIKKEPIYLHLDIDNFKPIKMLKDQE